jgi:nicotinate-nucleotide adenylyltransferase
MRIGFYGGTFDPVHVGHMAIGRALVEQFALDRFVFIPAFHAPHKVRLEPTPVYDRYAMLCLATQDDERLVVSRIEIEQPEKPFSVETIPRLQAAYPSDKLFFVMGADSWLDIRTWREWDRVLGLINHIVVTRPGLEMASDHVTSGIREKIVDLRNGTFQERDEQSIYFTDAVNIDVSSTRIREQIRAGNGDWKHQLPPPVANYIEKYQIYR